MSEMNCDIAVVGGGINGAATALGLYRAGFDVRLVDRLDAPVLFDPQQTDMRVYAISPASARYLADCGVWSAIRNTRCAEYEAMRVWEDAPERPLSFEAGPLGVGALGWIIEQSLIVDRLWAALPDANKLLGQAVRSLQLSERGVTLGLAGADTLQARLVISAEGGQSRLRDLAGIDTYGWSYQQTAVVAHVCTARPHQGAALQRFLPEGPLAFLPLADGRRSIVWSTSPTQAQALQAMDDDAFLLRLSEAMQFEAGIVLETTPRALFPLRLMHADSYVRDSFALLGDAAHVVHPLAGQGANLGLADAACLVRHLSAARAAGRDWGGARVLRRYERERRAANNEMLALTDLLNRSFRSRVPGLREVLNKGLQLVDRTEPVKHWLLKKALG